MPQTTAISILLLDLGNVVIQVDFKKTFMHWARSAGMNSHEPIAQRFAWDDAYKAHERGEIDAAEYFAHLRQTLRLDINDDALASGWNALFGDYMPGMVPLLQQTSRLKLPVYIFSNTNALHHECWSKRYSEALSQVQRVFCSHEMRMRKPAPEAFAHVAKEIGVTPGRIAFFDDLQDNADAACAAGMQGRLFKSIDDIYALLPMLNSSSQ